MFLRVPHDPLGRHEHSSQRLHALQAQQAVDPGVNGLSLLQARTPELTAAGDSRLWMPDAPLKDLDSQGGAAVRSSGTARSWAPALFSVLNPAPCHCHFTKRAFKGSVQSCVGARKETSGV